MPFKPGHKLSKGRAPGSISKKSWEFREALERHNFNPVEAMIEIYQNAKKVYDNYGVIYDAISEARDKNGQHMYPLEDNSHKYLKIAGDMAKDICSYAYPKLKAVENVSVNALEGMTPTQRLEAMKEAVKLLEAQVRRDEPKNDTGSGSI